MCSTFRCVDTARFSGVGYNPPAQVRVFFPARKKTLGASQKLWGLNVERTGYKTQGNGGAPSNPLSQKSGVKRRSPDRSVKPRSMRVMIQRPTQSRIDFSFVENRFTASSLKVRVRSIQTAQKIGKVKPSPIA